MGLAGRSLAVLRRSAYWHFGNAQGSTRLETWLKFVLRALVRHHINTHCWFTGSEALRHLLGPGRTQVVSCLRSNDASLRRRQLGVFLIFSQYHV
jgi:hypothetical protein